ncbi:unnamed protein product [Mytilus coruscus]|uniref:Uncharacterized protein n=1 Tax=Mytilus coruscus TaxID=42192 RepID=A0A6J8AW25_MYTCO|nr:unnamed protein product [Mytilus coruscus]
MLGTCESVVALPEFRQDRCAGVNIIPSSQLENDENGVPEHLQDLLTRSGTHLTPKEQTTLAELLNKYQDVFSRSPEDIEELIKLNTALILEMLVQTANAAVIWMKNFEKPTGQTARWLQELGTYDLNVIHRPGLKHTNTDTQSRVPCTSCLNQQTQNDVQNIDEDSKEAVIPKCTPLNQIRAVTRSRQVNVSAEPMKIKDFVIDGWDQTTLRQSQ